jgi:hypothetical protein
MRKRRRTDIARRRRIPSSLINQRGSEGGTAILFSIYKLSTAALLATCRSATQLQPLALCTQQGSDSIRGLLQAISCRSSLDKRAGCQCRSSRQMQANEELWPLLEPPNQLTVQPLPLA